MPVCSAFQGGPRSPARGVPDDPGYTGEYAPGSREGRTTKQVLLVAFDGFQTLDLAGSLDVFGFASSIAGLAPVGTDQAYRVEIAALRGGTILSSAGLACAGTCTLAEWAGHPDTVLVIGGPGAEEASRDEGLLATLRAIALRARRIGSVGTGAFILAAAGLLDGRRATTHWEAASRLASAFPHVDVQSDAIFVRDGGVYTSAGLTAGIDLALALVEEDHGRDVALAVARELVVLARRSGGQSQFSAQLKTEYASEEGIRALQRWMLENPTADLSVPACARRVGMSPRNFARVFVRDVGVTPAAWVEGVRVERARALLVDTERGIAEVASRSGFGSSETMRRAFLRWVGVSPGAYRRRYQMRRVERIAPAEPRG
ncbi:MAG TPA: GlxA family transcriptional regulator [Polyangiaceae bacterium]|jgi:transcriptional regulator GlxA family with amidase domain